MEKKRWKEPEKRRAEERRSEKRKRQKKDHAGSQSGRNASIQCVFPRICRFGGLTSRLAKVAGVETSGQMRGDKLGAVLARRIF